LSELKTDILIIGGGIAGCIAAMALQDLYDVTLVDKCIEPNEKIGESLAPAAQRILRELKLLVPLQSREKTFFLKNLGMQSYWSSDQLHIVDHLRNPDGLALSLDRQSFEAFLRTSAVERGVRCIWGASFFSSTYASEWKIRLRTNDQLAKTMDIAASYVIDASGRRSHFARSMEVQREVLDKLIACWMTLPNTHENTMSTISACKDGWWYSAVVPRNRRVLAFHTDADLIQKSDLKSLESFLKIAKQNKKIADLIDVPRDSIVFHGVVAANSTRLQRVAGRQWAAIGDAALSFDPLSSQGMFNAMATAMQLKELLKHHSAHDVEKKYQQQMDQIWHHYRKHRDHYYQAELRWSDSEFWRRRH